MVHNTGLGFIQGTFSNLAQGQRITLTYDGKAYDFVANYSGGTGNDLVLQWADTRVMAWGSNSCGQLGTGDKVSSRVPVLVNPVGALAGTQIASLSAGQYHTLALCADATLAAWGWNHKGQLGATGMIQSPLPVAIDMAGARIAQIAIGGSHNLVINAEGSMIAWGDNTYGQLGNNSPPTSTVPAAVDISTLDIGARVILAASGSAALHNLVVVALPSTNVMPLAFSLVGAPLDDSDQDGITNLIAYAFGLSGASSTARLPRPNRVGDSLEMRFTEPAGVTGITCGAQWSRTLQPGSWKDIRDAGTGNEHITSPDLFLRLVVTQP